MYSIYIFIIHMFYYTCYTYALLYICFIFYRYAYIFIYIYIYTYKYTLFFRFSSHIGHCYCSVAKSYLAFGDPMDCSTPGFPVLHCLPEFTQIHVHCVDDAIQPSHPLSPTSPAFSLSQHQGLF